MLQNMFKEWLKMSVNVQEHLIMLKKLNVDKFKNLSSTSTLWYLVKMLKKIIKCFKKCW